MKLTIQSATQSYLSAIRQLADESRLRGATDANAACAEGFLVSSFRESDYAVFLERADNFYVAIRDSAVVGFVLAYSCQRIIPEWIVDWQLRSQAAQPFVMVKQICTDARARRQGVATALYNHVFQQSDQSPVAAAIVLVPYNSASVAFHERLGFRKKLELTPPDGTKRGIWWREPNGSRVEFP